jgi:hypothetical protein
MDISKEDLEKLRPLVEKLGAAIDASLTNRAVKAGVKKIQKVGYNVILSLNLTLGVQKIEEQKTSDDASNASTKPTRPKPLTSWDKKFLREIKIDPGR